MKQLPKFNSILIIACVLVIVIGFALMTGAPSGATEYNPDIFSFRRITVGPMIALAGFVLMIVAILFPKRRGNDKNDDADAVNKEETR